VDKVLGGFGHVSDIDVRDSQQFLKKIKAPSGVVADCGAGIGRLTQKLFLPYFKHVDFVEPCENFCTKAKETVGTERVTYYCQGLQDFNPAEGRYDCIWSQWVLGHLTDHDLILFLQRCRRGLTEGGFLVIKENCGDFVMDREDGAVTRPAVHWQSLFQKSGLQVYAEATQKGFPRTLLPVYMFALR